MVFTTAQKVTKHLGYFWNKICWPEIPKIAQSGHTEYPPILKILLWTFNHFEGELRPKISLKRRSDDDDDGDLSLTKNQFLEGKVTLETPETAFNILSDKLVCLWTGKLISGTYQNGPTYRIILLDDRECCATERELNYFSGNADADGGLSVVVARRGGGCCYWWQLLLVAVVVGGRGGRSSFRQAVGSNREPLA